MLVTTPSDTATDTAIPTASNLVRGQLDPTLETRAGHAHYYLAPWEWVTEEQDGEIVAEYCAAPHRDKLLGLVDLRPLPAQGKRGAPEGYGFFAYNQKVEGIPDAIYLGDALDSPLAAPQKAAVKLALAIPGPPFKSSTVVDILWDVLTEYSDPTGQTAPRPLRGKVGKPVQLYLGGHGIIKEEPFTEEHRQRTVAVFQEDYKRNKQAGVPLEALQRWTGHTMKDLYGRMDDETAQAILPQEHRQDNWKRPATTINESWNNCADNPSLNCDLTWVEFTNSNWQIVNNAALLTGVSGRNARNLARADHNLSSDDHYAQLTLKTLTRISGDIQAGPIARKDANATETFYRFVAEKFGSDPNGLFALKKRVDGTTTALGSNAQDPASGDVMRLTVDRDRISGKINDVEIISVTDPAPITGFLQTGIWGFIGDTDNTAEVDDFEAADLRPGPPRLKAENGKIVSVDNPTEGVRLRGVHLFDFSHKYTLDTASARELQRAETALKPYIPGDPNSGWGANLLTFWVDTHPVLGITGELPAGETDQSLVYDQDDVDRWNDHLDALVQLCHDYNAYLLLAWHNDNGNQFHTKLIDADGRQAMQTLALRYKNNTSVIFAVQAEPPGPSDDLVHAPITWGDGGAFDLKVAAELTIADIRDPQLGNPDVMVGVPGLEWSQDVKPIATNPPQDAEGQTLTNIFVKAHNYQLMPYSVVNNGNDSVIAAGFPVIVGEFAQKKSEDIEPMELSDAEDLVHWAEGKPAGVAGYQAWGLTHDGCPCMYVDSTDTLTPWGQQTRDLLQSPPSGPDPLPGAFQIVQEIKAGSDPDSGVAAAQANWNTPPGAGNWLLAFVSSGVGSGGTVVSPPGWEAVETELQGGTTALYAKRALALEPDTTWQIPGEPIVVTLWETTGLDEDPTLTPATLVDAKFKKTSGTNPVTSFKLGGENGELTTSQSDVVLVALIAGQTVGGSGRYVANSRQSYVEATYNIGLGQGPQPGNDGWHSIAVRTVNELSTYSLQRYWSAPASSVNGIFVALRRPPGG